MKASLHFDTQPHQRAAARQIAAGLARHGIATVEGTADFAVAWGWRIAAPIVKAGRNVLVMERGYIGGLDERRRWTSLAWNGLNGRGKVPKADDGGYRWLLHFEDCERDWRTNGEYVVVMGQVPGDAALDGVDIGRWYGAAVKASQRFGLPVRFRPHPAALMQGYSMPAPAPSTLINGDLAACLTGAAAVVTFNSNTATDAVLAGVPAIACDEGSIAWPVAAHGLLADPVAPDRTEWCHDLAYRQWTGEEISAGAAWEHLKHGLDALHRGAG